MEMDRQTIIVLCCAIVGLTLFGGAFLAAPKQRDHSRPVYTQDDVRYKFQQEDLKKPKTKKKKPAADPIISSSESSSAGEISSDDETNEEPPVMDHDPQEEPDIE